MRWSSIIDSALYGYAVHMESLASLPLSLSSFPLRSDCTLGAWTWLLCFAMRKTKRLRRPFESLIHARVVTRALLPAYDQLHYATATISVDASKPSLR